MKFAKGGYVHMTEVLSEVSGRNLLSFAVKRAGFTKGDVYRIVQQERMKYQGKYNWGQTYTIDIC